LARAGQLDLGRPLYYGLRYAARLQSTPVPDRVTAAAAEWAPRWPLRPLMDALWQRGLRPAHSSISDRFTPLARFLLYVRAHWLRMPPLLLLYHLSVKAFRKKAEEP